MVLRVLPVNHLENVLKTSFVKDVSNGIAGSIVGSILVKNTINNDIKVTKGNYKIPLLHSARIHILI